MRNPIFVENWAKFWLTLNATSTKNIFATIWPFPLWVEFPHHGRRPASDPKIDLTVWNDMELATTISTSNCPKTCKSWSIEATTLHNHYLWKLKINLSYKPDLFNVNSRTCLVISGSFEDAVQTEKKVHNPIKWENFLRCFISMTLLPTPLQTDTHCCFYLLQPNSFK